MASPDIPRPQTPLHHPTYGVHVPHETIENIVRRGFPHSKLVSIIQLPSGKSYNNRIYFLKINRSRVNDPQLSVDSSEAPDQDGLELVLKVNGRFFGANKVENEVASLRLLEAHCPEIPAPRVFAWSCDGLDMTFVSPETDLHCQTATTVTPPGQNDQPLSHGGWMLISRVPGEPISNFNLGEATIASVMRQLADMATSWRWHIPPQKYCGNSRLGHHGTKQAQADIYLKDVRGSNGTEVLVRGVLMDEIKTTTPISSLADYYRLRLEKKLDQLETSDTYAPNRSLAPLVRRFIAGSLPKLGLDHALTRAGQGERKFIFTHYDLSPRNVLISGQPPRITGIVDFEFSGFFSTIEEFLNDSVGNDGDWPKAAYDAYLERLEQNGIATPGKGVDKRFWEQSFSLEKLVESIAPWWLPGDHEGSKLEEELKKAELVAREMMKKAEEP